MHGDIRLLGDPIWDFYIDLCTRVTIRELPDELGDEGEALDSIYKVFTDARECLKKLKNDEVTLKIIYRIMEHGMRQFLTKWHTIRKNNSRWSSEDEVKARFRDDLRYLQGELSKLAGELRDHRSLPNLINRS